MNNINKINARYDVTHFQKHTPLYAYVKRENDRGCNRLSHISIYLYFCNNNNNNKVSAQHD